MDQHALALAGEVVERHVDRAGEGGIADPVAPAPGRGDVREVAAARDGGEPVVRRRLDLAMPVGQRRFPEADAPLARLQAHERPHRLVRDAQLLQRGGRDPRAAHLAARPLARRGGRLVGCIRSTRLMS